MFSILACLAQCWCWHRYTSFHTVWGSTNFDVLNMSWPGICFLLLPVMENLGSIFKNMYRLYFRTEKYSNNSFTWKRFSIMHWATCEIVVAYLMAGWGPWDCLLHYFFFVCTLSCSSGSIRSRCNAPCFAVSLIDWLFSQENREKDEMY